MSFIAALLHPLRLERRRRFESTLPPLSAIVPVKDLHPGFVEAQRSLLSQNYSGLEILVAAADATSPALSVVRDLQEPRTPRIVDSDCATAASPKLNTLWPAICQAENDIVLSEPGKLRFNVRYMGFKLRDNEKRARARSPASRPRKPHDSCGRQRIAPGVPRRSRHLERTCFLMEA